MKKIRWPLLVISIFSIVLILSKQPLDRIVGVLGFIVLSGLVLWVFYGRKEGRVVSKEITTD